MGGPSIGGGGGKKSKKSRPSLGRPSGKRMAGWPKGGGGGKRSSATTSSDEDSDDFTLNKVPLLVMLSEELVAVLCVCRFHTTRAHQRAVIQMTKKTVARRRACSLMMVLARIW